MTERWREIERLLEDWCRGEGSDVDHNLMGDKIVIDQVINLTALAKYLADELNPPA